MWAGGASEPFRHYPDDRVQMTEDRWQIRFFSTNCLLRTLSVQIIHLISDLCHLTSVLGHLKPTYGPS